MSKIIVKYQVVEFRTEVQSTGMVDSYISSSIGNTTCYTKKFDLHNSDEEIREAIWEILDSNSRDEHPQPIDKTLTKMVVKRPGELPKELCCDKNVSVDFWNTF